MLTLFAVGGALWRFEDELDADDEARADGAPRAAESTARRVTLRAASLLYPLGAVSILAAFFSPSSVTAQLAFGVTYDCCAIGAGVLVQARARVALARPAVDGTALS